MRSEVSLRPAERGDLDAINAIESSSFPAPWRREFFESELSAPGVRSTSNSTPHSTRATTR